MEPATSCMPFRDQLFGLARSQAFGQVRRGAHSPAMESSWVKGASSRLGSLEG
jgi:hypothetical protein